MSLTRRTRLFLVILALAPGCDTRVVELAPRSDAGAAISCNEFLRADGVICRLCFSDAGQVTSASCPVLPPVAPPVMGPAASCQVSQGGDDRCLLCSSPNAGDYRACLKCEAPVARMTGGQCRACAWSDDANSRCLQCFTAEGIRDEDSCDKIRREPVIYPMAAPDAGGGR
jgi:hypothetical protein